MGAMASQITNVSIVCSTACSGSDQLRYQSSATLAFMRIIHRWPVDSHHKGPVTRKMFPFDDVIMYSSDSSTLHMGYQIDSAANFHGFPFSLYPRIQLWCQKSINNSLKWWKLIILASPIFPFRVVKMSISNRPTVTILPHWPLRDVELISQAYLSNRIYEFISWAFSVKFVRWVPQNYIDDKSTLDQVMA